MRAVFVSSLLDPFRSLVSLFRSVLLSGVQVRPGTNGGMSILGTIASIVGGTVMGICYWYFYWQLSATDVLTAGTVLGVGPGIFNATTLPPQWPIVAVGTLAGFVGSLVSTNDWKAQMSERGGEGERHNAGRYRVPY